MKWHLLGCVCLLFFIQSSLHAQRSNELTKSFEKTYDNISPDLLVEISNKFGEVKINTTNANVLKVKVEMKAWANRESKAQELLNNMQIEHDKTSSRASFETDLKKNSSVNGKAGFEINYEVTMPEQNPLELENRFGPVYVGDHKAKLRLEVEFGSLRAGKLTGTETHIDVKHGSIEVDEITRGNVESSFSKFVEINKAGSLNVDDKHGKMEIGEVDNLNIEISFSKLQIGKLNGQLNVDSKYAAGDVDYVSPNFESIDVKSSFGAYVIDMSTVSDFSFNVSVKFGSFDGSNDLDIMKQYRGHTLGSYEGVKGKGGNQTIKVDAEYGSVLMK